MPALLTHYLCGNAALELVEDDHMKNHISNHRNVFNLGTQGPDIFFYYGAWPWAKSKGTDKFGDRMHEERTGDFILEALMYAAESDVTSRSILTAYMCGYLCHYVLDCHAHPYVFYKAGFVRKGEPYTPDFTCYHRMLETALDVLMLKQATGNSPAELNASQLMKISGYDAAVIGRMYSTVAKKVYEENISTELVCQAIADIAGITAVLRDKTGIKKMLLSNLEKLLGKPPMFSSMIMPLSIKDGLDYLNISHSVWHLPWDASVDLTDSFNERFEAAAAESEKIIKAVLPCITGDSDLESILPLIGNRSFSTGCDCRLNLEFKYYDCIYG